MIDRLKFTLNWKIYNSLEIFLWHGKFYRKKIILLYLNYFLSRKNDIILRKLFNQAKLYKIMKYVLKIFIPPKLRQSITLIYFIILLYSWIIEVDTKFLDCCVSKHFTINLGYFQHNTLHTVSSHVSQVLQPQHKSQILAPPVAFHSSLIVKWNKWPIPGDDL